jgi:hypothetical protein
VLALLAQRPFRLRQPLLALIDEQGEALAIVHEHEQVAREAAALIGNLRAQAHEFGEIGGEHFGLMSHFGQYRPQHHGRAHRLQRVLGPDHESGRGLPADPLQRRQNLGDEPAPLLQRGPQRLLFLVERIETLLRLRRALSHIDDAGCGFDDLFVEFSPVVPDRLDLTLELGLVLENSALLGAKLFELLVALLERVERCGRADGTIGVGRSRLPCARRLGRRSHQPERQQSQRCQDNRAEHEGRRRHSLHRPVLCKNGSNAG